MPQRVFHFYQRKRVVNINLNILAAGFIAIALAKLPVMYISEWIGPNHKLLISVIAYAIDMVLDVLVYYALHWVANHWKPNGHHPQSDHRTRTRRFLHDATRVQAERAALVPLFALIALGGMWALQKYAEVSASWAFVFAFTTAMLTTRVVHTFWGYRSGTFKDTVDFVIDDDIQIGRDLTAEAQAKEKEETEAQAESASEPEQSKPDGVAP